MQDRFSLEDACAEERISLSSVNVSEDSERDGSYVKVSSFGAKCLTHDKIC